ncbi:MAG: hypothetical protein J3Q66DRAFT_427350, partial [Benniella sp.]
SLFLSPLSHSLSSVSLYFQSVPLCPSVSPSTVEPMDTTPCSLPQDGTGAPASAVRASVSVSQVDSHTCLGNSRPVPNNPVGSAQTFVDYRPQAACSSGLDDVTRSLVTQQHYQPLSFIHPSFQSPTPAQTRQQLARLQFQLAQSQQREEQLQRELIHRDRLLQQFLQQQLYLQHQQQHRPEQYFASLNGPPSQEPLPMNNGSLTSTQPWGSEQSPYPVASHVPLHPPTSVPSTFDPAQSSHHAQLPSTIQSDSNLEQSCQPHDPSASQRLAPVVIDCDVMETEHPDRVENCSKPERKRPQRRLTDEESQDIISRREGDAPESFQRIANAFGCSKSTVWRKRQKYLRQAKLSQKEDSQ